MKQIEEKIEIYEAEGKILGLNSLVDINNYRINAEEMNVN